MESSNSDGAIVNTDHSEKESVRLEVLDVNPSQLHLDREFGATVRLKNLGKTIVRIPWETNGELVTRLSGDGKEESYEVVDIELRLGTGNKRGTPVFLKAAGALFAHPERPESYLAVPPGGWVDIRIDGRVACGLSGALCSDFHSDEKGELVAWWYQRELIHRIDGCKEDYGNYVVREIDSKPLNIVVRDPLSD